VQIPKDKILEMIRSRGDHDQVGQAETELPDQVDTDQDQSLMTKFGISPDDLIDGLGSTFGMQPLPGAGLAARPTTPYSVERPRTDFEQKD
jgi:hypothetical protein